jgi:predicted permease
LQKQLAAIPGVRSASLSNLSMVAGGTMGFPVSFQERTRPGTRVLSVGPAFFSTMQIPMRLGREIDERDQPGSPDVAIVNELFARAVFGDASPIGQHITLAIKPPRDLEIVGVSQNARYGLIKDNWQPVVYIAYNQGSFPPVTQMNYVLRTAGDPLIYVNTVREIVHNADPLVPISYLQTQTAQIDRTINQEIIFARLCTGFAVLGLVIACVGLYGTMAYTVARRTGEIGIRMALGAQRGGVIWMVLRQVVVLAVLGLAIGLPIAYAASHLVESFLYGMKPDDPMAVGIAVGILLGAAVLAGYAPARRASRIDPMVALRHE